MRLVALQEIPGSVQIHAGQEFIELDAEKAAYWVAHKFALEPDTPNSRGWAGLHWDWDRVVILASGPSLTAEQCAEVEAWRRTAKNARVIAINKTWERAPWADVLYACDGRWWRARNPATDKTHLVEAAVHFRRDQMWTQDEAAANEFNLRFIRSQRGNGIIKRPGVISQGNASGYQAMGLAYWAGAKEIILLGFDGHGTHWHGDHPPSINAPLPHKVWIDNAKAYAMDFAKAGVKVTNCSPGTAITAFPLGGLTECLQSAPSAQTQTIVETHSSGGCAPPVIVLQTVETHSVPATSLSSGTDTGLTKPAQTIGKRRVGRS